MKPLKILYKCRLCGKTYHVSTCPKDTAYFIAENLCVSDSVTIHGMTVSRFSNHICVEGKPDTGFADFIGVVNEDAKESQTEII